MPSYDYECKTCDYVFTVSRSMSDQETPTCPSCLSSEEVSRVWGCVNLGGMTNKVSSGASCSTCSGGSCSTCC